MGECFFWYQPTQVVPAQRPLNSCIYVTAVKAVYWLVSIVLALLMHWSCLDVGICRHYRSCVWRSMVGDSLKQKLDTVSDNVRGTGTARFCIFDYSTRPPVGEPSIVMNVSVCVCVCLSVSDHIFGTTPPDLRKIYRACYLRLWRSDTLCTSSFMGDVIFARKLIGCSTSPPG